MACSNLAVLYAQGNGVPKDEPKAASLYERACKDGLQVACMNWGQFLKKGRGGTHDEVKAAILFKQACESGFVPSCYNYGLSLEQGSGTRKDAAGANRMFAKACDGGAVDACAHLAESLLKSESQDGKRSATLLEKACNANDARRCAELAALYEIGLGVSVDPERASSLRARACKLGYRTACPESVK